MRYFPLSAKITRKMPITGVRGLKFLNQIAQQPHAKTGATGTAVGLAFFDIGWTGNIDMGPTGITAKFR